MTREERNYIGSLELRIKKLEEALGSNNKCTCDCAQNPHYGTRNQNYY